MQAAYLFLGVFFFLLSNARGASLRIFEFDWMISACGNVLRHATGCEPRCSGCYVAAGYGTISMSTSRAVAASAPRRDATNVLGRLLQ